jgi:DNA-binding transcriptional LysR family regulator
VRAYSINSRTDLAGSAGVTAYSSKELMAHAAGNLGIVALRVKDFSSNRRVSVMYRKDAYLPPAAFRFIEILKATVKDIAPAKP